MEEPTLQERANALWPLLKDTLSWYHTTSCQCAFPRFHQYVSIDCVDYHGSFYMSETEGFIYYAKEYFDIHELGKGAEAYNAQYVCKKCGSTYEYGWADFSIHVDRSFLKVTELKVKQAGADALTPIPFNVGPSGHKLPDKSLFTYLDAEEFSNYLRELKK